MERLNQKLASAQKALMRFEEALVKMEAQGEISDYELIRDSVIQRFEFTYEMTWRLLRLFLEKVKLVSLDQLTSPRQIFRVAAQVNILSSADLKIVSDIIEDRNKTTHTYDEEVAEEIAHKLRLYADFMKSIIEQTFLSYYYILRYDSVCAKSAHPEYFFEEKMYRGRIAVNNFW
ncbi:MAG: Nucleotidyltransferase substrate binding protein, HI0074 family [candidate division TM6 bacterium GW2011_GWE2_42_60]|nr:MAG: Nucleotidyltransferase substrate binding protein, HI0074 family [candidate division TM6 bacterium GW2011_GWE2_42_60]